MAPLAGTFDLKPERPAWPARGPRLWRLSLGLGCVLAAVALLASHLLLSWWEGATLSEVGFVGGLMVIVGAAMTLQALRSDLFRVHLASLQTTGLLLEWSHVPSLTSPLHHDQRFMGWDEVASVQWSEGQQDHDLRQLLDLTFDQPLTPHRDRLQLMVSEGRNLDRCMALVALLPESTARPGWMARAQAVPPLAPDHEQSWVG